MTHSAAGTGAGARLLRTLLPTIVLACTAGLAQAQDSARSVRDGWIVGGVVGVPGAGSEPATEALTLGFVATRLVPTRRLGLEVAIGTMPRALAEGFVLLGARGGIAAPLAVTENVFLIPTAGVSLVGGAGSGGGGGAFGLSGGLSTVIAAQTIGFRAGITVHSFAVSEEVFWLFELGLVRLPFPGANATP